MIHIKHNEVPKLNKPTFSVDGKLHEKLEDFEITKLMNKHNFTLFLGKPGSGKSTLLISFLKSKPLFKRIYHKIILFCPPNSRGSIKDNFWDKNLEPEDIYDELTLDNLQEVYDLAQANRDEGLRTLVIFDDCQKQMKGEAEKLLLHMINNRRHASLSLWIANQNYTSIPKQVRMNLTDMFIFKVSKVEMGNLMTEHLEISKEVFEKLQQILFKEPHEFFYINTLTGRMFRNWDELIVEND
jgi:energy-coupling factor transporter ATP-binding protein EcfA2